MAYQIPQETQALVLLHDTFIDLYKITTSLEARPKDRILKNAVVTMFLKGHVGSNFSMRLHVYDDAVGSNILFSSLPVNNLDIQRTGDEYCEIRFDFPTLGNLMTPSKTHLMKFEIYGGYVQDPANYVALIMSQLGAQNFLGSDSISLPDSSDLGVICSFFFDTPNESTENFYMCRVQGSKLINGIGPSETAYDSGTKWYYGVRIQSGLTVSSFTIKNGTTGAVQVITNAGQVFTPDPLNYNTHLNQYYYNKKTGDLTFYTNKQLSIDQYAIMEYFLFLTETRGKYAPIDMAGFGNSVVYWEPRIAADMNFDFSQQNNLQGILSISSSALTLKNQDGYFNSFFSVNDCFNNREVKVWRCTGDVTNNTFEFLGLIRSVKINDNDCTFEITDPLSKLDNTFNDNLPKRYGNTAYTLREIDKVKMIPRVIGKISKFQYVYRPTGYSQLVKSFDYQNMIQATNVLYDPATKTTSTNRKWSIGFGPASAATQSRDVTAVASLTMGSLPYSKFTINNSAGPVSEWLPVGTVILNNGKYAWVFDATDTDVSVWPQSASFTAAQDIFRQKVVGVVAIRNGEPAWLVGSDYTCQIGASGDLQITLTNNFEAAYSTLFTTPLDPDSDEIFAVLMNDEADAKSSSVVKDLLQKASIPVSASFAPPQTPAWNAWADIELALTIDGDFPKYRDIIEQCLKSAMSFIYVDTAGEFRYKSFMHPMHDPLNISLTQNQSSVDASDDINQRNSKEFSMSFDLWDLHSGVAFNFTQCKAQDKVEFAFNMVRDFYKTENLYEIDTVIDPTRIASQAFMYDYHRLVVGRSAFFSVTALAEQMGLYIGDDIVLKRKKIIAGDTEITLRVVSRSKRQTGAAFTLMDLKNFPGL